MDEPVYFGGVEGGATHSNLVICDGSGAVVGRATGPGTNHFILGVDKCMLVIDKMLNDAKMAAGLPADQPLKSIFMSLSGCEQDDTSEAMAERMRQLYPHAARHVFIGSDTVGSLATGAPNGGLVLISGTGSNALLRNPDGSTYGCGGWGHMLGDEGSAYYIAHRAVKTVFDAADGLAAAAHDPSAVWRLAQEHFGVATRADLLPHAYSTFNKSYFASLAAKIASRAGAGAGGDELCRHLLRGCGRELARHVVALAPRAAAELRPLRLVCVGSVWRSWAALKPGFVHTLAAHKIDRQLELVQLRVSSAIGSAWLAAKKVNFDLPRDDATYCHVFYKYDPVRDDGTGDYNVTTAKQNGVRLNGFVNGLSDDVIVDDDIETCSCVWD